MKKYICAIIAVILCISLAGCDAYFDALGEAGNAYKEELDKIQGEVDSILGNSNSENSGDTSGDNATGNNTPESSKPSGSNENTKPAESDVDILLRANHPKWLDNVSKVHSTWPSEIDAGKVVIPGVWETLYGDNHILEITSYGSGDAEYIGAITFHFGNADKSISLDTALNIIATYLPVSTIQNNYREERSYYEVYDGVITKYVKSHRLIDENNGNEKLQSTFDILIWVDEKGNVTEARIDSVGFGNFDEEVMRDWNYSFFN